MWTLLMYIGPLLSPIALVGITVRIIQLLKGDLRQRYQRIVPWGKAIVGLAGVSSIGVFASAIGAAKSLHFYFTCDYGGGCAQGEFGIAFSLGVFGLTYMLFEMLLLPLSLSIAKGSHA